VRTGRRREVSRQLRRRRTWAAAAALASGALAVGLGSCGVPGESAAHRIEPADVPFDLLTDETSTTLVTASRATNAYLIAEDRLVAVDRSVPKDSTLADLLQQLVAGPTEVEQSLGITSAVPAGTIESVNITRGIAEVDLTAAFGDIRSGEQIFALGQIVYTLTGQPGIGGVRFSVEGEEVQIPVGEGPASDDPLARDDFSALEPA
jgi:spore germination protein GerM